MKITQWLISLFTKESKPMTEPVTTEQPAVTDAVAVAPEAVKTDVEQVKTDVELFEAKLKELVTAAGSQAHAVFDDLCKLAKQLI
ncbi:hypothetical protein [Rosenbergiella australiborealis]|uniref:hypothetical protein n=1 Tax=Rosenbergiella australiborealis TaxID=1544696 RepID=UPI001F4D9D1C|nr:hypothetical protein [Rosenbergiella australiborealis]